jgi:hypothetical protein
VAHRGATVLKKSRKLGRIARYYAAQHDRLELAKRQAESEMRRVQGRQQWLWALGEEARRAEWPIDGNAAWVKLRGGYIGRTDQEMRALVVIGEQLRVAVARQTRGLRRSSGRQRGIANLLTAAEGAEQRREDSLQQAEADQRAGISRKRRDEDR